MVVNKNMKPLFPSLLFEGNLENVNLCDDLEKEILKLIETDQVQVERNGLYYIATTEDNLQELEQFKEISDIILKESESILDFYKLKRESHYISNMWSHVTHFHNMHQEHIHPNCFLSGILYIRVPKYSSQTIFCDPRPSTKTMVYEYEDLGLYNSNLWWEEPVKGKLLIWPHWLPHCIDFKNSGAEKTDEKRIVLAFNIMVKTKIEKRTAKLNLR